MIGTQLVEELVQSVAMSHRVKGYRRCSLLLLAAPESGKTTIATAASCTHVESIALMSGRSILREINTKPHIEFLLFNDLTMVRALSPSASALLITMLNQLVQDERGAVAFAGKEVEHITRPVGLIGCLAFSIFADHRAKWKSMGFVSRMIPFAYEYGDELIAEIKDSIDNGHHPRQVLPGAKMPRRTVSSLVHVDMSTEDRQTVRRIADARAKKLGEIGIRLLLNYHALIRGHALLMKRTTVTPADIRFLRAVDEYVSITKCTPLKMNGKDTAHE